MRPSFTPPQSVAKWRITQRLHTALNFLQPKRPSNPTAIERRASPTKAGDYLETVKQLHRTRTLTHAQTHTLTALVDFYEKDGCVTVTQIDLAAWAGVSSRTALTALQKAQSLGLIKKTINYRYDQKLGKKVRTTNTYEITPTDAQGYAGVYPQNWG